MDHVGCVTLVGAGPGDPDLLTVKAQRLIREAEVIVHDRLIGDGIFALFPPTARLVDVGKASGHHAMPQDDINRILYDLARAGARVVRLKGGDPFVFGRGGEEMAYLAQRGIPVEVVPGITAAVGAAASLGLPLTHRGVASGVRLVTGHARDDGALDLEWRALADPCCTLVIYMGVATVAEIATRLLEAEMPAHIPVAVIRRATLPDQEVRLSTLGRIAADVRRWHVQPPALIVIGWVVDQMQSTALLPSVPVAEMVNQAVKEAVNA